MVGELHHFAVIGRRAEHELDRKLSASRESVRGIEDGLNARNLGSIRLQIRFELHHRAITFLEGFEQHSAKAHIGSRDLERGLIFRLGFIELLHGLRRHDGLLQGRSGRRLQNRHKHALVLFGRQLVLGKLKEWHQ